MAKPGIILGGDLNIVKFNTEIDTSFIALTISNDRQQKELSKKAQGKSVVHLRNSDLKEVYLVTLRRKNNLKLVLSLNSLMILSLFISVSWIRKKR